MRTAVRLMFKQYRLEIFVFALGAGIASLLLLAGALYLDGFPVATCDGSPAATCASTNSAIDLLGPMYRNLAFVVTPAAILAGLLVGVTIVGREVETRTAVMAWTLSSSRIRWLVPRVVVAAAAIAVLAGVAGLSLDTLFARLDPGAPLGANLREYELRGWLVPARALEAFAIGTLAGAVVGRGLQAFIVAILVAVVALGGQYLVASNLNAADATPMSIGLGDLFYADRNVFRDRTTGELLDEEAASLILPLNDPAFDDRFEWLQYGIDGSNAPIVVGREVTFDLLVVLALLGLTALVTNRRRPY
jgi:ABC-type transport system involved in multi-copper enzyme maturation permease subunit